MPKAHAKGQIVRLEAAGYFSEEGKDINESVYERPVMIVYQGSFDSMDGPVDITDEHIQLIVKNHNSLVSKFRRLASGEMEMKDCPPLQVDHSSSALHTVGRVVGEFSSRMAEINGSQRLALFGVARFLGKENVEKAKDGRWTHVSIGADLTAGKINELSVTPFPAAPHASLLSKPKLAQGEPAMHEKLKKHLMDSRKMSEEDAEKLSKKILSHQMSKMGKSEEEMGKHMSAADDAECSRMWGEHDEDEKKLAADKEKEDKDKEEEKAKMTARRASFVQMAKSVKSQGGTIHVELKKSLIHGRIAMLRAQAKIMPAEIKKLDIVKMAAMSEGEVEAALSTFELREPILQFGAMAGTAKAEGIEKVSKKYRLARMELESRMNMPSKRAEVQAQLKALESEEQKEMSQFTAMADPKSSGTLAKLTFIELSRLVDEGKKEEVKAAIQRLMEDMPNSGGGQAGAGDGVQLSALAKSYSELQTKFDELVLLAAPALGIKPEELK